MTAIISRKVDNTFVPVQFEIKNLESVLANASHLAKALPARVNSITAASFLSSMNFGWNIVKAYGLLMGGKLPDSITDEYVIEYTFTHRSRLCLKLIDADPYSGMGYQDDGTVSTQSGFDDDKGHLSRKGLSDKEFKDAILDSYNVSYRKMLQELFQKMKDEFGIDFTMDLKSDRISIKQVIPRRPDTIYVFSDFPQYSPEGISLELQKYILTIGSS